MQRIFGNVIGPIKSKHVVGPVRVADEDEEAVDQTHLLGQPLDGGTPPNCQERLSLETDVSFFHSVSS